MLFRQYHGTLGIVLSFSPVVFVTLPTSCSFGQLTSGGSDAVNEAVIVVSYVPTISRNADWSVQEWIPIF